MYGGIRAMALLIFLVIGVAFAAFTALVFAALTLLLAKLLPSFEVSGPDDWSFFEFYKRYLIIAAVFTFVSLPLGYILGIGALALAYKYVFDAGLVQAAIMGTVGGLIAATLFFALALMILKPLGL
jgi:hypothetical protein